MEYVFILMNHNILIIIIIIMNDYLRWVSYGIGYSFLLNYYYNRNHNSNYIKLLSRNVIYDHK